MNCPDCNHAEHEPGQCPFDNCGESAISHSSWRADWDFDDGSPEMRAAPCYTREVGGMDVRDPAPRIKSRFYNRRELPRKEFDR